MTWALFQRDSETAPWTYLGATDTKPVPSGAGDYVLVDLDNAVAQAMSLTAQQAAARILKKEIDEIRDNLNLKPLDADSLDQVRTIITT